MSVRNVVVVEDEPFLRSLIENLLTGAGFEVASAGTAAEARKLFNKSAPDAAIFDIDLGPGPTGLEMGEALLNQYPGTAVVYLTMLSDPRVINPKSGLVNPRAAYLNKRDAKFMQFWAEQIRSAVIGSHQIGEISHRVKELEAADKAHTQAIVDMSRQINSRLDEIFTIIAKK